ncbi:uncharacterized protein LOC142338317 [Convolutriloba macropyga]|uniref:uncharacterized protein LOC142338317 n=1 Tax=Convolutriloba macropyga TaxID=536237 RepID=UPI003F51C9C1
MAQVEVILDLAESEANDSNLSSSPEKFSEIPYFGPLFQISSYGFVIIGFIAAVMNFTIFSILVQKRKKMASELLVVVNLVIDGCYGLLLVLVGLLNITKCNLAKLLRIRCLNCIIAKVPPTFLTFASLLLVLIIALNRFMAVKYPSTYKDVFKPKLVRSYLAVLFIISGTLASIDLGMCIADPLSSSSYSKHYSIFWVYVKFVLVMIAAVAMFLVYKLIAKQFSRTFWSPIALPFTACCSRSKNVTAAPEAIARYQPKTSYVSVEIRQKKAISFSDREEDHKSSRAPSNNYEPMATQNVPKRKMTDMTILADVHGIPPMTDHQVMHNGNIARPMIRMTTDAKRVQRRARKSLTLQQQKHYVTTIFFFVCFLFLAVSLPSSISHLINLVFSDTIPITFLFNMYLLTETLYGINFVLNPYLFSFNNSYLKERMAEMAIFRKLQFFINKSEARN